MAILRYAAQEARNIAKAQAAAEQTARIEGSLAQKLAATDAASLQAQIDGKEPTITAGTTAQYWRGDKAWVALDKAAVGLPLAENTSDLGKPISTATQTALNGKEATISAGTTAQYWRGDKSWQTLNKASVGLTSVDDTADTAKPVSTATQTALNGKASLVAIATLATNAAATITPTASVYQLFHTGTLTADRLMTLTTAGMTSGYTIRFTRTGSGAFNLSIGGLKNLITNSWCDVVFNGSVWVLTAYGTL